MQTTPGANTGGDFTQGAPVYDTSDSQVGRVSEHGVQRGYLVVHHGLLRRDVYVPLNAITQNSPDRVTLSLSKQEFLGLQGQTAGWEGEPASVQATHPVADRPETSEPPYPDRTMTDQVAEDASGTTAANQALNATSMPASDQTPVQDTALRETTLPPNQPTSTLTSGEITSEGVTMEQANPADNVGTGNTMNETGGWSNLGNRDLVTGTPANAEVQGATPSFPDGNNVVGTREGPELLSDQQVMGVGGQPVGNESGVMGTGAGPVGTSMGPGVVNNGDVTVNSDSMGAEGTANAGPMAGSQGSASVNNPAQSGAMGSGNLGDVVVNGNTLPSGESTVLNPAGLMGQGMQGMPNTGSLGGSLGDQGQNAITDSNAGTEFTGMADSGTLLTPNGPNQGVIPGGIGSQAAADEVTYTSPSPDTGLAGANTSGMGMNPADTGVVGAATGQGVPMQNAADSGVVGAASGTDTQLRDAADTGLYGTNVTNVSGNPTGPGAGVLGTAVNTGPNAQLRESADTGLVGASTGPDAQLQNAADTGLVGSAGTASGNISQQGTLADQLRADQPVGDVLSPEENPNQPPA